ncbi:MAG TPA: DUF1064 domain-containing protein, partial [Bellilinea sp.]|nr:DUF1064 domain-containing protein [Bellilinea sp.]
MTYRQFSRSKYNAKKASADGFTFDSQAEERRYQELKPLEQAGKITGLEVHKRYRLTEAFKHNGETVR